MSVLILPSVLESYRSMKDMSLKLSFATPELSPEKGGLIHSILNKPGYLAFNPNPFSDQEIDALEKVKVDYEDNSKPPSQRLRAVIYLNWKQDNEGYLYFNQYYQVKMEKLIDYYKSFLP